MKISNEQQEILDRLKEASDHYRSRRADLEEFYKRRVVSALNPDLAERDSLAAQAADAGIPMVRIAAAMGTKHTPTARVAIESGRRVLT